MAIEPTLFDDDAIESDEGKLKAAEVADDANVEDAAETESTAGEHQRFNITSFGADLSVFDLTRRLGRDILIPAPFQRKYVWPQKQASRFIESILLGLPVPGIFIFERTVAKGRQQLIVDGQQRLITLDRFLKGVWEKKKRKKGDATAETAISFHLQDVAEPWNGKTFSELDKDDRDAIENYLVHATIFRQDQPKDRERSIYEVFERINTGGLRLSPQEIRACVSHGKLIQMLAKIADHEIWRSVYGKRSPRLKDEELILRYFALSSRLTTYARPMKVFLDDFLEDNVDLEDAVFEQMKTELLSSLTILREAIGEKLFRPENALNAAVFDATMIGISRRLSKGEVSNLAAIADAYQTLLENDDFKKAYKRATADEESVKSRIRLAEEAFDQVL